MSRSTRPPALIRRSRPASSRRSAPPAPITSAIRTSSASAGTTRTTTRTNRRTRASARTDVRTSRASGSKENDMERIGTTGFTSATDSGAPATPTGVCASCGQTIGGTKGLEQFLGKLGISEEMIANLNVDEYLDAARDYLKHDTNRATTLGRE